ncbi:hypothetical protein ACIRQY_08170 [Streptomyces sp. NPDC101490]|uniref:hypothetical protein n=1 Tax=Streptomyces sp. NPDC101490 TaxID=3366143 RepID=UPI003801E0FC
MSVTIRRRAALGALSLILAVPLGLASAPSAGAADAPVARSVGQSAPQSVAQYRSDWNSLNGYRLRQVGTTAIYVVMDGQRRLIPDMATHTNLFGNSNVQQVIDLYSMPDGGPLSSGAILATSPNSDSAWLISNGIKRGITFRAFEKYEFDWSKIRMLQDVVLFSVPQGPNLDL